MCFYREAENALAALPRCEPEVTSGRESAIPAAPPEPRTPMVKRPPIPGDQHLTVLFGTWIQDDSRLQVQDFALRPLLVDDDRDLLGQSLTGGRVVITGSSTQATTDTPRARMIVLFTGPLGRAVKLQQPDATEKIYLQTGDSFGWYPTGGPFLTRVVAFTPTDRPDMLQ